MFTEIKIIEQLANQRIQRALPDGLQVSHFAVLNHFSHLGGEKTPAQLAKVFQVTKGAMTNTVARLEAMGCVEVRPDGADGRKKLVSLTAEGRRVREARRRSRRAGLRRYRGRLRARSAARRASHAPQTSEFT